MRSSSSCVLGHIVLRLPQGMKSCEILMSRKRSILLSCFCLVLVGLLAAAFLWSRFVRMERGAREGHFITIHFLAHEASLEASWGDLADDPKPPEDIDGLLLASGGQAGRLQHFPYGIVYRPQGSSFTLEERRPAWVSLWGKDRLVATERKWPRWEATGEYARKFPDQAVPPSGFE